MEQVCPVCLERGYMEDPAMELQIWGRTYLLSWAVWSIAKVSFSSLVSPLVFFPFFFYFYFR